MSELRPKNKVLQSVVVLGEPIEIIDGNEFNKYNCVQAIKTFKHKDYCCPFCSHGETIQLKVFDDYRGRLLGTYRRAYLECSEKCMAYGVFERTYCKGNTDEETLASITQNALEVFEKMIKFTKDRTEFVMVN